jgi:hypothetical protein
MAEIKLPPLWRVNIIESELGWGNKIDETKYFDSEESARTFVKHYNTLHNPPKAVAPDWYMIAEYVGPL